MFWLFLACSDNELNALEPAISLAPASDFPALALGDSGTATVTLSNVGRAPLTVHGVEANLPFEMDTWDWAALDPGDEVILDVSFEATMAGAFAGEVLAFSDDPDLPIARAGFELTILAPDIVVDPDAISFEEVVGAANATVYVTNEGPGVLVLSEVLLDADDAFSLVDPPVDVRLDAEDILSFEVAFDGTPEALGEVLIYSNDPDTPEAVVALGVATIPPECEDAVWPAIVLDIDESCVQEPVNGTLDMTEEWRKTSFSSPTTSNGTWSLPVVGNLTDDDGDGIIDDADDPDIVVITWIGGSYEYGAMRILNGADGTEHLTVESTTLNGVEWYVVGRAAPSLGDVDQDGVPEIITTVRKSSSGTSYVAAFEPDGTLDWVSTTYDVPWKQNSAALADLEGDGDVEVVVGGLILNGADGTVQGRGTAGQGEVTSYSFGGRHVVIADLDSDGILDIVAGRTVYGPTGTVICSTNYGDGYPSAGDLDGDGYGEFVVTGDGYMSLFEHDCSLTDRWAIQGGGRGGPATVADFDGDGNPELGVAGATAYNVYEVDGTLNWSQATVDSSSNATGSAVMDFEGDGVAEVVYHDEVAFYVFDGPTGAIRYIDTDHSSPTANEYPVIADVDGDGSAEVVTPMSNYGSKSQRGLSVRGSSTDSFMSARPVWNQHAYNIVNINDDLSIPTTQAANWPDYNSFRSADLIAQTGALDVNAQVELVDICTLECDQGSVRVVVRVTNEGPGELAAGLGVVVEEAATGAILDSVVVASPIAAGQSTEGLVFDLALEDMTTGTLRVVADPFGIQTECNEDDNELLVLDGLCE
jgi:hypothetical protein